MSILIGVAAGTVALATLLFLFARADAHTLAKGVRLAGPVLSVGLGGVLMLFGRAALGGMLLTGGLAWYARSRQAVRSMKSPSRRSTVRTAAVEMELDHDTGQLEGIVLAGSHEGRVLGAMEEEELFDLHREIAADGETRQLLETYLDGRFPGWREHLHPNAGAGEGVAPGSGAMTKEEAYKVLGLEAGASPADVRQAHRRLMQRLHPDVGGSPFLAARINEAKDVLLSDHN